MKTDLIELAIKEREKQLNRKATSEHNALIKQIIKDELTQLNDQWKAVQQLIQSQKTK